MTSSIKLFIITTFMGLTLISCKKEEPEQPTQNLKDIEVTTTSTDSTITLSWKPVEGVSWYQISVGKQGESMNQIANYQNLTSNPITYTVPSLTANTTYDIKMEGTDYASGGKLLARKTFTASTNP